MNTQLAELILRLVANSSVQSTHVLLRHAFAGRAYYPLRHSDLPLLRNWQAHHGDDTNTLILTAKQWANRKLT